MTHYLIVCRSITHAQRMSNALRRAGLTNWILRLPAGLVKSGCGYAVKIREQDFPRSLEAMRRERMAPVQVFATGQDGYQEVSYDLS